MFFAAKAHKLTRYSRLTVKNFSKCVSPHCLICGVITWSLCSLKKPMPYDALLLPILLSMKCCTIHRSVNGQVHCVCQAAMSNNWACACVYSARCGAPRKIISPYSTGFLLEKNFKVEGQKTIDHCFFKTIGYCFSCSFYCFSKI